MKRILLGVTVLALAFGLGGCGRQSKETKIDEFHTELFGENVYFFSPGDDPALVQDVLDQTYARQETNQFGDERFSFYFLPGDYDDSICVNVGFYTQVAGLGEQPTDTKISELLCLAGWLGDDNNHNATCNFWRGVENIEIKGKKTIWAVSQATDMRRVRIDGSLYLHDDNGWASGGFLADSRVDRMIDSGTQQQWLSRNNAYSVWMGDNWNIVFLGDDPNGIPNGTWPNLSYTRVDETPVAREKPFLVWRDGAFFVMVPDAKTQAIGPDWSGEEKTPGRLLPISDFYVAKEGVDTADTLQAALDEGRHLFFTPGIYELSHPLSVTKEGTILLGSGLATLRVKGDEEVGCLETTGAGITVAGLLFDAGSHDTATLVRIGRPQGDVQTDDPISISDLYFRVGGGNTAEPVTADACLVIDADGVVGDNLWVWRADHGDQVAWDKNVTKNGVIINGDGVKMYALMVEHFHEYQTVWNGEDGYLAMYQSEVPYDVPDAALWKSHDGQMDGYASIYVADDVKRFNADGIGIYLFNRDAAVPLHAAMETPRGDGIDIRHIITVLLSGNPGMQHVINDTGGPVIKQGDEQMVLHYKGDVDLRFK